MRPPRSPLRDCGKAPCRHGTSLALPGFPAGAGLLRRGYLALGFHLAPCASDADFAFSSSSLQAGFTSKTTQARLGLGSLVVTICKKFSGVALGFHLAHWSSSNPTIFKVLGCLDTASSITTGLQGLQHSAMELVDAAPRVLPPQHLGAPLPGRVSAPRFSAPMGGTNLQGSPTTSTERELPLA